MVVICLSKELGNSELEEGDSLTIECSTKDSSTGPPSIVKDLQDVHVKVGEPVKLSMTTKGM